MKSLSSLVASSFSKVRRTSTDNRDSVSDDEFLPQVFAGVVFKQRSASFSEGSSYQRTGRIEQGKARRLTIKERIIGPQKTPKIIRFVVLNFNGQKYQMRDSAFRRLPCNNKITSTSLVLPTDEKNSTITKEYFLEHDISCFKSVVNFYQRGGLHVPKDICLTLFKMEMMFWEIDLCHLSPCCALKYSKFNRELMTANEFRFGVLQSFNLKKVHMLPRDISEWKKIAYLIMYIPSSKWSRIYRIVKMIFVLISVLCLVLDSYGAKGIAKNEMRKEHWIEYFKNDQQKLAELCENIPKNVTKIFAGLCEDSPIKSLNISAHHLPFNLSIPRNQSVSIRSSFYPAPSLHIEKRYTHGLQPYENNLSIIKTHMVNSHKTNWHETTLKFKRQAPLRQWIKLRKQMVSANEITIDCSQCSNALTKNETKYIPVNVGVRKSWFEVIHVLCYVYFQGILIMELLFARKWRNFLFSFHGIILAVAVMSYHIELFIRILDPVQKYTISTSYKFASVRIILIFEWLKHSKAFRVLRYSLRHSLRDVVLVTIIGILSGGVLAAVLFNLAEDKDFSILDSFWVVMCSVTGTTYGDFTPNLGGERFCLIITAIIGVCFLSIMVPIFSFDFLYFYSLFINEKHLQSNRMKALARKLKIIELKTKVEKNKEQGGLSLTVSRASSISEIDRDFISQLSTRT